MSEGAFYFILAMIGAAFVVVLIEWLYRRFDPSPDEEAKKEHEALMKEIRRHKDE